MVSVDRESIQHALEIETNTMQRQKLLRLLWKLDHADLERLADTEASLNEPDCRLEETTMRQPRAKSILPTPSSLGTRLSC
jgi:hypothetical protein